LRLTRGLGGLRLAIADGVDRIEASGGVKYLGFSSLDAYGRERLGRSGRWLGDARTLNRRLASLSLVRDAFLSGGLSPSKAELVARTLSRLGDSDEASQRTAIEHAKRHSVRELRAQLGDAPEPDRRPTVQITRTVDRLDALAFEGAIRLAQALGAASRTDAVEGLLAEAMTTLFATDTDIGPALATTLAGRPIWEPSLTEAASLAGTAPYGLTADPAGNDHQPDNRPDGPTQPESPCEPVAVDLISADVTSLFELDVAVCDLAAELTRRDLRLGELALEAEHRGLPNHLGYDSPDAFYREWLGMAPSSMAARIALSGRSRRLPQLRAAIEFGRIGFEAATLLGRVASPSTEGAWLALADTLTVKLLREHLAAAELHARLDGRPLDGLIPPAPAHLEAHLEDSRALERHVFAMAFGIAPSDPTDLSSPMPAPCSPTGPMSVPAPCNPTGPMPAPCNPTGPMSVAPDPAGPMSVPPTPEPDLGTTTLRLSLPEDLATFWRHLESAHTERLPDHTFIEFLVTNAFSTWRTPTPLPAYGDIYLRDRFRCQSPTCTSRNCTPHHIIFRSHGGTEDPSNLVTLCDVCHLELVHGHHLTVTGQAPDQLQWRARTWSVSNPSLAE